MSDKDMAEFLDQVNDCPCFVCCNNSQAFMNSGLSRSILSGISAFLFEGSPDFLTIWIKFCRMSSETEAHCEDK